MTIPARCVNVENLVIEQLHTLFEVSGDASSCFVATPLLTPDNSEIEVEVTPLIAGGFRVGDAGAAGDFLFLNGVLDAKVRERSALAVRRFGFTYEAGELFTEVPAERLGRAIIETAMTIQDVALYRERRRQRSPRTQAERFRRSVERAIAQSGGSFTREVEYIGKRDVPRKMDYLVSSPSSNREDGPVQLALFLVTGDSDRALIQHADLAHAAILDLPERFRAATLVDPDAPGDPMKWATSILGGSLTTIIPFHGVRDLESLLAA